MALTVIDAGVTIAILDAGNAHHASAKEAVRQALTANGTVVLPVSAYSEGLVVPFRHGPERAALVDSFVDALPATLQAVTREIAREAARLRAQHGPRLRLPDALVIATALELSADRILTTYRRWPDVGLPITAV